MYPNLEAELARIHATQKDIAKIIGCTPGTVSQKMGGKSSFSVPEAKKIQNFLGGNLSIEYLFATTC